MGLCTSTKDLWLKLEKVYQIKREDIEDIPIKDENQESTINEGKDSPQSFDCNNVDVECSPASKEEYSDTIEEIYVRIYPMEEVEEELSDIKKKVDWGFVNYQYDHSDSEYNYLYEYTREFLEMIKDNENPYMSKIFS
jgi:hypothetical protein